MAKKRKMGTEYAGDHSGSQFYIAKDFGAVIEFSDNNHLDNLYGPDSKATGAGAVKIAKWGADNQLPQEMLRLVNQNHMKPQLIVTERDFLLGNRLGLFKKVVNGSKVNYEPIEDAEREDWAEMVELEKFMRSTAYNLAFFNNYFAGCSLGSNKKVEELRNWDCNEVRAELIQNRQRRIENYFIHPTWKGWKPDQVTKVPAFDRREPTRYGDFMFHGRDWMPGQPYYDVAPWWGTKTWTEVSNLIPVFHKNGLKNGYNIKYHIKIPLDYFNQFKTDGEKRSEEGRLVGQMNEMLAGVENPEKVFVSKYGTDTMGKPLPGWEILPIENKMSDDAYSKVNDQANIAQASGHGIDPTLASIDTGGKLGGSGSEKRISTQIHIAHRTPNKRKILLEILNICDRLNGWDKSIVWGFEDTQITTLDVNPTGTQSTKLNQ